MLPKERAGQLTEETWAEPVFVGGQQLCVRCRNELLVKGPGGSVTAGLGIYDAMQLCRADVSTVCFGLAASMGAFLLCAGAAGKRGTKEEKEAAKLTQKIVTQHATDKRETNSCGD